MIAPILSFGAGWFKSQHQNVRNKINADSNSQALTDLNFLATNLQTYVNNISNQTEKDKWTAMLSEIAHTRIHLDDLINIPQPQNTLRQKNRCLRILDGIETAAAI